MNWRNLGLVYCASGENEYMQTHALNPLPLHLDKDVDRIYFSSCDAQ